MSYSKKFRITIDNTKVGGSSGSLTDFPVLIYGVYDGTGGEPDLRTVANGGDIQNVDATGGASGGVSVPADLAFYNDEVGSVKYDHEVVNYNATTGQFECWVRIPTLNKATDTEFFMHFGDGDITDSQENIGGVWETNYKGVWHLGEASGTRYDSSGNGNHLTDNNTVTAGDGKVGGGADFELTNSEYLDIADASQTGLDITGDISIKTWINLEQLPSVAGGQFVITNKGNWGTDGQPGWYLRVLDTNEIDLIFSSSLAGNFTETKTSAALDSGHVDALTQVVVTCDVSQGSSGIQIYLNGSPVSVSSVQNSATSIVDNSGIFSLGARRLSGSSSGHFDGIMDEAGVYSGLFSADYITTSYNNENSPDTFYSLQEVTTTIIGPFPTHFNP